MLRNHLITSWRHLVRHRAYAAINLVGLSVGIAFCLLAIHLVAFEHSFDRFHAKADRVARVTFSAGTPDAPRTFGIVHDDVGPELQARFPQVVRTARLIYSPDIDLRLVRAQDRTHEVFLGFAEGALFGILSFPEVEGDPVTALNDAGQGVLSARTAERLFGTSRGVIGRGLQLRNGAKWLPFIVGAVIDIPTNSTYDFELLLPYRIGPERGGAYVQTLVEVREPDDFAVLQQQMPAFSQALRGELVDRLRQDYGADYSQVYAVQPLTAMHQSPDIDETPDAVSPTYGWALLAIAVAVLLIACVNFVTLALALAADRWREVGLRKSLGADRSQVARQFWMEAVITTMAAVGLGWTLAEALLPTFRSLTGRAIAIDPATTCVALLAAALLVALLTGAYPALVLSRPLPAQILRGEVRFGRVGTRTRLLVGLQLALSVLLVAGALTMARQIDFLLTQDLGFNHENVVVVNSGSVFDRSRQQGTAIRARFRQLAATQPEILDVSASWMTLGQDYRRGTFLEHEGEQLQVEFDGVDYDFARTLGLRLVAGRDFSRDHPGDIDGAVVVSEALVQLMGWTDPLGQQLQFRGRDRTVVGVLADFHVNSLHDPLGPVFLYLDPDEYLVNLYVRIAPGDAAGPLAQLERTWNEVAPELPFRYTFLDDDVTRMYYQERRWGSICRWGAGLAVGLACLGALALASLAAVRRTREIGIRKSLGATTAHVVRLLTREFVVIGLIAAVIATPAALLAASRWLDTFAYHADLGVAPFLLAGSLVVGATLLVVGSQAVRASQRNPVDALHCE